MLSSIVIPGAPKIITGGHAASRGVRISDWFAGFIEIVLRR